jgi:hypothetical protein
MKAKRVKYRLATIDSETDPARRYRMMEPFSWGFWDGTIYKGFWGKDCTTELVQFLRDYDEPLCIYAHNGGKFDFMFLREHLTGEMAIIGSRIVKVGFLDKHELRDSFALIPSKLDALVSKRYGGKRKLLVDPADPKSGTDWNKFEPENRERHKAAIEEYQAYDCYVLYDAIERFQTEFGANNLTMAQAAMRQCHLAMAPYVGRAKVHVQLTPVVDSAIRNFYYGGRVQTFKSGPLYGAWKMFDVRSMYPSAMQDCLHPIGNFDVTLKVTPKSDFVYFKGWSKNWLPKRLENGALSFGTPNATTWGTFYCTIHEFNAGLEVKRIGVHKVLHAQQSSEKISFGPFIKAFYEKRMRSKTEGDDVMTLFYKLVMNSAYGKFAMTPERYKDYVLVSLVDGKVNASQFPPDDENAAGDSKWRVFEIIGDAFAILSRKAVRRDAEGKVIGMTGNFLNVGTAASITGAARAKLAMGIFQSQEVAYCDTDSIICQQGSPDMEHNDGTLGTWEHQASGDALYILGKKMYALYQGDTCIKYACKGVNLSPDLIRDACLGKYTKENPLVWHNQFPTMSLSGEHTWMSRRVRNTADAGSAISGTCHGSSLATSSR